MKKFTILSTALLLVVGLQAQVIPTLTQSKSTPSIGETYNFYTDGNVPNLAVTHGGANATWDFSSINSNIELTSFTSDANSPNPGTFPGCNLVEVSALAENYLQSTTDAYSYVGQILDVADITYTDPADILQFPITFGDVFTDNITGTANSILGALTATGTGTISADGHGDLITSYGTFTNVLRIHVHQEINVATIGNLINDFYFWYDNTNKVALASYVVLDNPISPSYVASVLTENDAVTSVNDVTAHTAFNFYPNPAQNTLTIENLAIGSQVSIMSISGQELVHQTANNLQHTIDVSHLPNGMYLLKVNNVVRQFVKSE